MRRKLALFLPSLRGGGAERVMVMLANRMADKGHVVHLVLAQADGPYISDVQSSVQVIDLKAKRVATSLWPLIRYLFKERPFALLSTLGHANVVALMANYFACRKTRTVIRLANVMSPAQSSPATHRILSLLIRYWYPKADHVVAVSQGVAADFRNFAGLPSNKLTVINNPVDINGVVSRAKEAVEHPWFKQQEFPVIIGMGRLTKQKDFVTLIRAFARVKKVRNARLLILGEGEERETLESVVAGLGLRDYVSLPGFVPNPYAYLARAAVFILSSKWEGFPNVLLETIALGTPIVATNCHAGPAEILENGRLASLVPVGDDEAMAEAILLELEKGPGPRKELKRRAGDFSPESVVDQYLSLLTEGM